LGVPQIWVEKVTARMCNEGTRRFVSRKVWFWSFALGLGPLAAAKHTS